MKTIKTKTTYLEMFTAPSTVLPAPVEGTAVERLDDPTRDEYLKLYRSVGDALDWVDRVRMPPDELVAILHDLRVNVFVLRVDGQPAGFSELDRRQKNQIELAYFGLFPAMIGQGLGKFFLNWTLHQAWEHRPDRVWLHTCDLDHPAALPNYQKAGFQIYDERMVNQIVEG